MTLDERASGTRVAARIGDTLEVTLAENVTTGHRWAVVADGAPVCRVAADEAAPGGPGLGASGRRRLVLEVRAAGRARVALEYRRRWEAGPPARRFELEVEAAATR